MLLQEPGLRLDEVSEAVGFANESTFYRKMVLSIKSPCFMDKRSKL